jgi:hypothetical protein
LGVVLFLATALGRAAAAFVLFVVVLAMIALLRVGVRTPSQPVASSSLPRVDDQAEPQPVTGPLVTPSRAFGPQTVHIT